MRVKYLKKRKQGRDTKKIGSNLHRGNQTTE